MAKRKPPGANKSAPSSLPGSPVAIFSCCVAAVVAAAYYTLRLSRPSAQRERLTAGGWLEVVGGGEAPCTLATVDAQGLTLDQLAARLRSSREPVLIRHAMDVSEWALRSDVLAAHSALNVTVTMAGEQSGAYQWAQRPEASDVQFIVGGQGAEVRIVRFGMSELAEAMRNGSVGHDSYCFDDVQRTSLESALPEPLVALNDWLLVARHGPKWWSDEERAELVASPRLRGAIHGGAFLAMGVNGSGGSLHAHTDALLGLLLGRKRWIVAKGERAHARGSSRSSRLTPRQEGSYRARALVAELEARGSLTASASTADGHDDAYWQCVQEAGELVWMPEGLSHTVLNVGETIGVSLQTTDMPYDLLSRATFNGHVDGIAWLLERGGMPVNARVREELRGAGGAIQMGADNTALHTAAWAGHGAAVVSTLVEHGASLSLRNGDGLLPLHVAAAEGHPSAVRALLAAGAILDEPDAQSRTALLVGTISPKGNLETVRALLEPERPVDALEAVLVATDERLQRVRRGDFNNDVDQPTLRAYEVRLLEVVAMVLERQQTLGAAAS